MVLVLSEYIKYAIRSLETKEMRICASYIVQPFPNIFAMPKTPEARQALDDLLNNELLEKLSKTGLKIKDINPYNRPKGKDDYWDSRKLSPESVITVAGDVTRRKIPALPAFAILTGGCAQIESLAMGYIPNELATQGHPYPISPLEINFVDRTCTYSDAKYWGRMGTLFVDNEFKRLKA